MKWRECVGGCENLQGELRGGRGGVTPAVNGGAGEKTRQDALVTWRGDYICLFQAWRSQIWFCHHFTHTLTTTTLFSPPWTPSTITKWPVNSSKQPQLFWCCSKFIYLCLFMCVFTHEYTHKDFLILRFHPPKISHSIFVQSIIAAAYPQRKVNNSGYVQWINAPSCTR